MTVREASLVSEVPTSPPKLVPVFDSTDKAFAPVIVELKLMLPSVDEVNAAAPSSWKFPLYD